ncbi:MAG: hypothetical protein HY906_22450 [Deltaproteobacteria bacterium]|nr:hypothetical protein [Deltaproteobacteria bacterium]
MRKATDLLSALAALRRALAPLRVPYMIIGGVAVQARGVARTTRDVDATVRGDAVPLPALVAALRRAKIVPRVADFRLLATQSFILLLTHAPSGTPIDLSLAWVDFEQAACARATPVKFGRVTLPVATLEDLLVLKTVAWRERDRADVLSLLSSSRRLDLASVEAQVRAITDAMEVDDRIPTFRKLVAQARRRR